MENNAKRKGPIWLATDKLSTLVSWDTHPIFIICSLKVFRIRRRFISITRVLSKPFSMALEPPLPLIPFLPFEGRSTQVHLKFIMSFHTNSSKDIMNFVRQIHACESRRQRMTVVCVEYRCRRKFVATTNGDIGKDGVESQVDVITAAIWVFKKLAAVIEMKSRTQPVPSRKPPIRIWTTCSSCKSC
jgi:hypothetical protein